MTTLPHRIDREIEIAARPDTVFRFFTDPARWASWWGAGSTIDATPGGRVLIRYPGGVEAAGQVVEIDAPKRIVFTYGYVSGTPIPAGASRVTIGVATSAAGSRVTLRHELDDAAVRDAHVQGWRYQLSLFANIVSAEVAAGVPQAVDGWLSAWAEPDEAARRRVLEQVAEPNVRVRDRFTSLAGIAELMPHIGTAQQHMPGVRLERRGDVRVCQGMAVADWTAFAADGREVGAGTNVFELSQNGKLASVTGFWNQPAS
jgi:uncharacterized protein YndB with AHSA1/START domain